MIWILYAVLATGEAGPVGMSEDVCRLTAKEVAAGTVVKAMRFDGSEPRIVAASCLGPADVEPCDIEAPNS